MNKKKCAVYNLCTAALFGLALFTPAVVSICRPAAEFSEIENRLLAQRPSLSVRNLLSGEFEQKYEQFLSDQFMMRNEWIGLKTTVEQLLLRQETKDVYFASDGYFIEKHSDVFSAPLAERNIRALREFVYNYKDRFSLSVCLVPNAVDILEDKLPPLAPAGQGIPFCKHVYSNLDSSVWVDAAAILYPHRDEELYYRSDHHWKTLSAFYVYQAWALASGLGMPELSDYSIEILSQDFQGTIQSKLGIDTGGDRIEAFFPKDGRTSVLYDGDQKHGLYWYEALNTKDKYAVFLGGNRGFCSIVTDNAPQKSVLIIKDSYANCFIPFLTRSFNRIDVLDLRYTNQKTSELIKEGEYDNIFILYNAAGFAEDLSFIKINN